MCSASPWQKTGSMISTRTTVQDSGRYRDFYGARHGTGRTVRPQPAARSCLSDGTFHAAPAGLMTMNPGRDWKRYVWRRKEEAVLMQLACRAPSATPTTKCELYMKPKKKNRMLTDLARFGHGFVYAWHGICAAVLEERNFRFHLCAALYVFAAAHMAHMTPPAWRCWPSACL
mgnify:CR=1 FL=1